MTYDSLEMDCAEANCAHSGPAIVLESKGCLRL